MATRLLLGAVVACLLPFLLSCPEDRVPAVVAATNPHGRRLRIRVLLARLLLALLHKLPGTSRRNPLGSHRTACLACFNGAGQSF